MIILGVDPGTVVAGYGFLRYDGARFQVLEAGPIRLKAKGELPDRLLFLADTLDALFVKHRPDVVSIEKVFGGVNFQSTLRLGYARGVVLMLAARHGATVAEYAPNELKKAITGYGRAEKQQMQEMVRVLLNLRERPKPSDVADALALAICHAHASPALLQAKAARGRRSSFNA